MAAPPRTCYCLLAQGPKATYPRLLGQVCVHFLLAEWRHILDLFVIALYNLPVLGDLLRIQKLVGRRVLGRKTTAVGWLRDGLIPTVT